MVIRARAFAASGVEVCFEVLVRDGAGAEEVVDNMLSVRRRCQRLAEQLGDLAEGDPSSSGAQKFRELKG